MSEVWTPEVEITTSTVVDYDPVWIAHPSTEIETATEVLYGPPPSSGGQPVITITTRAQVLYTAPLIYIDTEGSTEIFFTTKGEVTVEVVPVPVPEHLVFEPIRRVSITMPRPGELDQFGRPQ